MNFQSAFTRVDTYTYESKDKVIITLFLKGGIHYEFQGRSIAFDIQPTKIEFIPIYVVYVPENATWEETGELITPQELMTIKRDIVDVCASNGIAALLTPKPSATEEVLHG